MLGRFWRTEQNAEIGYKLPSTEFRDVILILVSWKYSAWKRGEKISVFFTVCILSDTRRYTRIYEKFDYIIVKTKTRRSVDKAINKFPMSIKIMLIANMKKKIPIINAVFFSFLILWSLHVAKNILSDSVVALVAVQLPGFTRVNTSAMWVLSRWELIKRDVDFAPSTTDWTIQVGICSDMRFFF